MKGPQKFAEHAHVVTEFNPACENRQTLEGWHLSRRFQETCDRFPDKVAITDGVSCVSYSALNQLVRTIGRRMKDAGVNEGDHVAVSAPRSTKYIASILAILHIGAVYVPIPQNLPAVRQRELLSSSQAKFLIGSAGQFPDKSALLFVDLELLDAATDEELDCKWHAIAYIAFTSGSTGVMKGAVNTTAGLLNHLDAKIADCQLTPNDVVAQTAETSFCVHIWQMLAPLLVGSSITIVKQETLIDVPSLLKKLKDDDVTVAQFVPTYWRLLLEELSSQDGCLHLATLVLTGEIVPTELCRATFKAVTLDRLINAYGQTECADDVSHYVMTRPPDAAMNVVPIGKAIQNSSVTVRRPSGAECDLGEVGEIVVDGIPVALGYLNDREATESAFSAAPDFKGRRYHTGDLGRYLATGDIECLGRTDYQIKISGQRVEIGEIEAALRLHPAVRDAAVIYPDVNDERCLVAFIQITENVHENSLRLFLRNTVPLYMIPQQFIFRDALPMNANGKMDRRRLYDEHTRRA
ncbi:amino acid adenylation domain-containing protein [Rhizobium changzhiense]|uniref:amino acid adenylation domain-containing protein n=1 Tax=Rhizobium changzhiense TaxID=2692317 RepID=UPI001F0C7471|nr:amino acid adenylation domain-containing protein [Rhizobium changzhiense]